MPSNNFGYVSKIVELAENYLSHDVVLARPRMINILSHRKEYYAITERLIDKQLEDITIGKLPSSERVEAILNLTTVLHVMEHRDKAHEIFLYGREIANKWDSGEYGRSLALTAAAEAVQRTGRSIRFDQAVNLVEVFDYVDTILHEKKASLFDDILRIISRDQPHVALAGLHRADYQQHIDLGAGLAAICSGLLDNNSNISDLVWPIIHTMKTIDEAFLEQCAGHLKNKTLLLPFADTWARNLRLKTGEGVQIASIVKFLGWAQEKGLKNSDIVIKMQHYLDIIQKFPSNSAPTHTDSHTIELKEYRADPAKTFEEIKNYLSTAEDVNNDFLKLINEKLSLFTNQQKIELTEIVYSRSFRFASTGLNVLVLLVNLAESIGNQTYNRIYLDRIRANLQGFIESDLKSLLVYYYYLPERVKALSFANSSAIDDQTFFKAVLTGVTNKLLQVSSDFMYLSIAFLANRLSDEANNVFETLLQQALESTSPSISNLSVNPYDTQEQLVLTFLCDYLADPRLEVCWRIVHCLTDMALHLPNSVLPHLFKRAKDHNHERWMSTREWILFIMHHVALHKPELLTHYVDELVFHALNKDFPHAKIREHAKQALLSITAQNPEILDQILLEKIKSINEPKKIIPTRKAYVEDQAEPDIGEISTVETEDLEIDFEEISHKISREEYRREFNNSAFNFYIMDTIEDWFAGLGRPFGENGYGVAAAAMKWVSAWNITEEMCDNNHKWLRKCFGGDTMIFRYKNEFPPILGLKTYVEYHCQYLVAGEWIENKPVHINGTEFDYYTWQNWVSNNIYDVDPAIISRLTDHPTLYPENYGISPKNFDKWAALDDNEEFARLLTDEQSDDWLVINESSEAHFYDYSLRVQISAVTVVIGTP